MYLHWEWFCLPVRRIQYGSPTKSTEREAWKTGARSSQTERTAQHCCKNARHALPLLLSDCLPAMPVPLLAPRWDILLKMPGSKFLPFPREVPSNVRKAAKILERDSLPARESGRKRETKPESLPEHTGQCLLLPRRGQFFRPRSKSAWR